MAQEYIISYPVITGITLSANPVKTGVKYTITVTAIEETRVLEPVWPYSNDVYSGEWPTTT